VLLLLRLDVTVKKESVLDAVTVANDGDGRVRVQHVEVAVAVVPLLVDDAELEDVSV
jgi:hypothetical protein